ncbi:MAG: prolipoprotein diacylglyceryl transferase [Spirochaetaceae bacterium]|jgi:phosphatidylglycerol:prolipoprotein diacylglycerol transferase|nr:prolipoprotein diacylglyceryl transferase [Spirochaetaceae bacterium]
MLLSIQFPSFINPEIIPGLPIRWYGLMYIVAFSIAYFLYKKQVNERRFPMTEDELSSMFFWCVLGLILGARIFSTLIYEPLETNVYIRKPWLIFWPFYNGRFTGFQGMSYHGGVIGGILGIVIWSKTKKFSVREIADMFAASIPLGYTFGRIGNFINAELYGRVTASPIGMIFPIPEYDYVNRFSSKLKWVRDFAEKTGVALPSDPDSLINLPRHPSQLYEAFFEGIFLWMIIWIFRNKKPFKGFLAGLYLFGYGLIRFIIEYFRAPDADLGYRIQFGQNVSLQDTAHIHPLLSFSTGQILCAVMMILALLWWFAMTRLSDKKPVIFYQETEPANGVQKSEHEKKAEKNARRSARKKLK